MFRLNLRSKIIIVLTSLCIASLGAFGYVVYGSFSKDKEAYVVKSLLAENQHFTELMNSNFDNFQASLTDKIEGRSVDSLRAYAPNLRRNQDGLLASGVIFEDGVTALDYSNAFPLDKVLGFSYFGGDDFQIIDKDRGLFVYFMKIKGSEERAFVIFKDLKIAQFLADSPHKQSFIKTPAGQFVGSKPQEIDVLRYGKEYDKSPFGLIKIENSKSSLFLTYGHLKLKGYTFFTLLSTEQLFGHKTIFMIQIAGFVVLFTSLCCLVGVFFANRLTKNLDLLSAAAISFENQEFGNIVQIQSQDEFGELGKTFNAMGNKIQHLLTDLKVYNTKLEDLVEIRTSEIQHLSRIQNAMLNSLGQSFTLFDRDLNVVPIFSKITSSMYDIEPIALGVQGILDVSETDRGMVESFVKQMFNESIPFEHLSQILPKERSNSKNDSIILEYAAIRNEETQQIEYIMVIGTDKTQEILSNKKTDREVQFSKMLLCILRNPSALRRILKDSYVMLKTLDFKSDLSVKDLNTAMKIIHTLKGNFAVFRIKEIIEAAHTFEDKIELLMRNGSGCSLPLFQKQVSLIRSAIDAFISAHGHLVKYGVSSEVSVPLEQVREFRTAMSIVDADLVGRYDEIFLLNKFNDFFDMYTTYADDLSQQLGKQVDLVLDGGGQNVPSWFPTSVLNDFVHLLRNSLDHGIETPEERLKKGKSIKGEILLSFTSTPESCEIKFGDDGAGIDVEALSKIDPSITSFEDAVNKIVAGSISSKGSVSENSGRGIGLSALVDQVLANGGSYSVHSDVGVGTLFTFNFKKNQKSQAA